MEIAVRTFLTQAHLTSNSCKSNSNALPLSPKLFHSQIKRVIQTRIRSLYNHPTLGFEVCSSWAPATVAMHVHVSCLARNARSVVYQTSLIRSMICRRKIATRYFQRTESKQRHFLNVSVVLQRHSLCPPNPESTHRTQTREAASQHNTSEARAMATPAPREGFPPSPLRELGSRPIDASH